MAGIGFKLRSLVKHDNLFDVTSAYLHSAIVSTGPWIFTILTIAGITVLGNPDGLNERFLNFHAILFYNFSFSLIVASPFALVATRVLADSIYAKKVASAPGTLAGAIIIATLISFPFTWCFYFIYTELPAELRLLAFANFYLVVALWIVSVFLTALKDYWSITIAFGVGMGLALISSLLLKPSLGETGMLLGFSLGLSVTIFMMLWQILLEYNYPFKGIFKFFDKLAEYKDIAVGGFIYALAIWIDKIIMAFAPGAIVQSGMPINFAYAEAVFLAYLFVIPAMAIFMMNVETDFFIKYHSFYQDITDHAPYSKIEKNHIAIKKSILEGARNIVVIQGIFCFLGISLAHKIFAALSISYMEISIFRLAVLGGFFHVLMLFSTILLYYFECRRPALYAQAFFAATNGIFTVISIYYGEAYYGFGYFLSALLGFFLSAFLLYRHVLDLPYHTFITYNTSLR